MSESNPIVEAMKLLIEYAKENGRLKAEISLLKWEIGELKKKREAERDVY